MFQFSFKEGDKIDIGSYRAKEWIDNFEKSFEQVAAPQIVKKGLYAIKGKRNGLFDPKSYLPGRPGGGSQISKRVYVSNRDLGNYATGAFGRISGMDKKDMMIDFGAYQLSKGFLDFLENRGSYRLKAANFDDVKRMRVDWRYATQNQRTYGEEPNSNWFNRLGFEGIRTMQDFNSKFSKITED